MKKTLALSVALLWGVSTFASAAAMSLANVLDDPMPKDWGYTQNNNIDVVGFNVEEGMDPTVAEKDFVLRTPVLTDEKNQEVQEYTIFLSEHPIKSLIEGEKRYEYRDSVLQLPVYKTDDLVGYSELRIPESEDGIEKTKYYYGFVVPSDNNGDIGDESINFCFNFFTEEYSAGAECDTLGVKALSEDSFTNTENDIEPFAGEVDTQEHGVAGADMSLADISHTVDSVGKVITLTWSYVPGSEYVKINVFSTEERDFVTLATVNMLDEKYEYHYDDSIQEFIFEFVPTDGGKEKRYDVNVRQEIEEPAKVEKVPTVGPVEDMLMIFGVAVLLYGGYAAFRSKAKVEK